jgi:hypothetical protein
VRTIAHFQAITDELYAAVTSLKWASQLRAAPEALGACSAVVVSGGVTSADFAALLKRGGLPKAMRYEASTGEIVIYDLGCPRHGIPIAKINGLAEIYSRAQGGRRVPPALGDFSLLADLDFSLGGSVRVPDATLQPRGSAAALPVLVVEVGAFETVAQLDDDAQVFLGSPLLNGEVRSVLIVRVFQRRPGPGPTRRLLAPPPGRTLLSPRCTCAAMAPVPAARSSSSPSRGPWGQCLLHPPPRRPSSALGRRPSTPARQVACTRCRTWVRSRQVSALAARHATALVFLPTAFACQPL